MLLGRITVKTLITYRWQPRSYGYRWCIAAVRSCYAQTPSVTPNGELRAVQKRWMSAASTHCLSVRARGAKPQAHHGALQDF